MSIQYKMDKNLPGGIYLCQVNEKISCGACCGLYNVADASFDALTAMLSKRRDVFEDVHRDVDSILDSKRQVEAVESPHGPFPKFYHCPFLGLIGPKRSRVGCFTLRTRPADMPFNLDCTR